MNLLLLESHELSGAYATLKGRRATHAREVLKLLPGDDIRVGVVGGQLGTGRVVQNDAEALALEVTLETAPPARPGIDLLLAIPRPKALKKVLPAIACMGVDRLVLVNAARVEKSYFQSYVLQPDSVHELLCLGLEQARDTVLPQWETAPLFRPFVEDRLDTHFTGVTRKLLAHPTPSASPLAPSAPNERTLLAIGPEGGWVPFEVELLEKAGFRALSLGERILRVEVAVPYLLGRLSAG